MPGFPLRVSGKFSAARQVWILAGLASGTLATILVLISVAALRLIAINEDHGRTEDRQNRFSRSLNLVLSEAQRQQVELLGESPASAPTWVDDVAHTLGEAREAGRSAGSSNDLAALESSVVQLRAVTEESFAWNVRRQQTRTNLLAAKVESESLLRALEGAVTSISGRLHLKHAAKIRRLRSLPAGPDAEALAREILSARDHDAEVGQIQSELSTLALLCEQMAGEKELDPLKGYKDNLLAPALLRLERSCSRLAHFDPDAAERIHPLRQRFEQVLFGPGYRIDHLHQSIVPGTGGFDALCRLQLDLDLQHRLLRRVATERLDQVRADEGDLRVAIIGAERAAASEAARALSRTWKCMLGLGALCIAVFMILARRIARTLKGHLETIELSNQALARSEEESRQSAESLRQSEQLAQTSLRELASIRFALDEHAIIAITDPRGAITHVNEKFCDVSGYSRAELIGRNHRILNSGRHSAEFFRDMYRTIAAGKTWRSEICNRAKDGRLYWVDTTIVAFPDLEGKPAQYVAIRTDITERKKAEAAHAESEIRFRQLAENISDVFWIVTPDNHQMIYVSPAFEPVWGFSCQQLYDNPALWLETIHRDDLQRVTVALETKQADGTYDEEYRIVRADGAVRWIWDRAFPIHDADGRVHRVVGVARDVTEQRSTMEAAKRLAAEAQAASKAKGEFLATMSHEIRTPMNGVIGFAGLLLDSPLNEAQRQYASIIRSSGESLLSIINDILDFSRIEANKLFVERIPFDLAEAVSSAASLLGLQASDKGIALRVEIDPAINFRALADPVRFRQVLLNLLGNALKFTECGSVIISAQSDQDAAGSAAQAAQAVPTAVTIRIKDTGIGIAPEKQKLLFQKFTQADSSTTRKFGGTGLGLAISKSLVELMGGEIGMESEPGQGSTFWFTVPVVAGRDQPRKSDEGPPRVVVPNPTAVDLPSQVPWRVLVAEDTLPNQKLAEQLLKKLNCRVDVASDGRQAVELAQQNIYDIIFMDLHMPEMDGCEATREIRLQEKNGLLPGRMAARRLPIIALTASVMEDDRLRCREAGMDGFLTKPVSKAALTGAIEGFLASPGRAGDMAGAASSSATSQSSAGTFSEPLTEAPAGSAVAILATPGNSDRAVFDYERLSAETGEDEFLPELMRAFLEQLPKLTAELEAALRVRDSVRIRRAAHALKGSVRLFHVEGPIQASQAVEFLAREGRLGRIDEAAAVMKYELEQLRLALENTLQRRAA